MSSYIHFFIRAGSVFAPIGTYLRGSKPYEAFEHCAPYEKIRALQLRDVDGAEIDLRESIKSYQKSIEREKAEIEWLKTANFSLEDRMDLYYECAQSIEEYEEELPQLERSLAFCSFLREMISEAEDEAKYGENPLGLDPAAYIYIGIDCGSTPTFEDLEK